MTPLNNWIWPYMKENKGRVILSSVFALLGVFSGTMLLFVSGYLISKSSLRPENVMMIYIPIVSVRAFSIGQAVFPYLDQLISHDIVLRILAKYRDRLYAILEPQAVFLQSRYQTGDLLTVLSDDIEKLQDLFIKTILPSVAGLIVYTLFLLVIGLFDPIFMLLLLLLLGIIVFLMPLVSYRLMAKKHVDIKASRSNLYRVSTDSLFGQLDWLVSGRVSEVIEDISKHNRKLMHNISNIQRWDLWRDFILQIVVGVIVVSMLIWTDIQTGNGSLSPTVIAGFVLMVFSITDALLPLNKAVEDIPSYEESLHRLETLEQAQEEEIETVNWSEKSSHDIVVSNLHYRYPKENKDIVRDVSFTIKEGEKVAILGRSGAGKSTLLKLLSGLLKPDQGEILIGGQPVHPEAITRSISILNQKPHLFNTTVANNVRIGRADASEEEVIESLKQAQMYDYIDSLPEGLNTQMEELGQRFSGGERQRIAFARALIQETPIILLDEPTVGLDQITERELIQTFLSAVPEKTIVLVTHHLAGAEWMDKIIFIDEGEIMFAGRHEELMETNEYYRTLYEMDQGIVKEQTVL